MVTVSEIMVTVVPDIAGYRIILGTASPVSLIFNVTRNFHIPFVVYVSILPRT
jgi:hypothetical protein